MTDKKFPKPEDIQREFEDFIQKRFGGQVQVITQDAPVRTSARAQKSTDKEKTPRKKETPKNAALYNFDLKPRDVKNYLDRFVIGQDEAKKALSIAVCDHYMHVASNLRRGTIKESYYAKQNVLVLGPTGVGKTFLVKHIANLLGVPFVKADATKFSETGYIGGNVEDMVRDLVAAADNDIQKAEFGIIYVDEVDKLASSTTHHGRDVSGRGVQLGLLKMMEECEIDLRSGNDPISQMQAFMEMQQKGKMERRVVNTKFILFIVSGAFSGLEDIVSKRLNKSSIGFSSTGESDAIRKKELLHSLASTNDFISFGFEPEFVGRLPVRVSCNSLDKNKLMQILQDSEASILNQYRESFAAYGIDLQFDKDALEMICEIAIQEKTGARALMTVFEKVLRDFKFDLPSSGVTSLVLSKKLVRNPSAVLAQLLDEGKETDKLALKAIRNYEEQFAKEHGMKIRFNSEAVRLLGTKAIDAKMNVEEYCAQLLTSYEHGLKLINLNIGQTDFDLGKEVVEAPKQQLEKMVKESYAAY